MMMSWQVDQSRATRQPPVLVEESSISLNLFYYSFFISQSLLDLIRNSSQVLEMKVGLEVKKTCSVYRYRVGFSVIYIENKSWKTGWKL